jgi:drug/metabolite transporter (DMT)-like permease
MQVWYGQRKHRGLLITRGLTGSIAFSLAYTSLPYLDIGDSTAIFFLHPVFTALLSWPVLQEKVGLSDAPAVLLGILGTTLIVQPPSFFHLVGLIPDAETEAALLDETNNVASLRMWGAFMMLGKQAREHSGSIQGIPLTLIKENSGNIHTAPW